MVFLLATVTVRQVTVNDNEPLNELREMVRDLSSGRAGNPARCGWNCVVLGRYLEICYMTIFLGGLFIHYLQRSMTWPKDPSWRRSIFCTDLCFLQKEMMGMDIDTVIRSKPTMFTWAIPDMNPGSTKSLAKEPHQLVAEGTWRYKVWWNRQCFLKFLLAIGVGYLKFVYGITWKTYNIVNGLECRTIEWDCFAFWDCCPRSWGCLSEVGWTFSRDKITHELMPNIHQDWRP